MSSSFQLVGRHMRGDWLNTWIAVTAALHAARVRCHEAARRGHVGAD